MKTHKVALAERGFTMVELLVVLAVIGALAGIVLIGAGAFRKDARATTAVAQIGEIQQAIALYYNDTREYPPSCRLDCDESSDPLQNQLGVSGWNGPYFSLHDFEHPWGGRYLYVNNASDDFYTIILDNDPRDIPEDELERIDEGIDDGDIGNGNFTAEQGGGEFRVGK